MDGGIRGHGASLMVVANGLAAIATRSRGLSSFPGYIPDASDTSSTNCSAVSRIVPESTLSVWRAVITSKRHDVDGGASGFTSGVSLSDRPVAW